MKKLLLKCTFAFRNIKHKLLGISLSNIFPKNCCLNCVGAPFNMCSSTVTPYAITLLVKILIYVLN